MTSQSSDSLSRAFAQASLAAARLEVFAQKAKTQDRTEAAALFVALAASQKVHARRFLMLMRGKVEDTEANLSETIENMLPALLQSHARSAEAEQQAGGGVAATALDQAAEVTARQLALAKQMGQEAPGGQKILVCPICGWLAQGQAPERCPVCSALGSKFQAAD